MEPGRSPAQLIADSEGLLLDFDGPVCDVYAGSDPARIARDVAATLNLSIDTDDPLDLITYALATEGPVDAVHEALTETEVEAVRTATETPGIRRLITSYHGPVAIVSNNATEAISSWLKEAGLEAKISAIQGRNPYRLKPDPWPLDGATASINRSLDRCIFVGDSLTDAEAAHRAGTTLVALANRSHKRQLFESSGILTVVDSIEDLLSDQTQTTLQQSKEKSVSHQPTDTTDPRLGDDKS